MTRPEWVKCIAHWKDVSRTWCGGNHVPYFVDPAHAAINGAKQGRLVACPACVRAATAALQNGHDTLGRLPETEFHGLDTADEVFFYEQDFYVLSNFSAFNLQWGGHVYPTSEHAYQAAKFADWRDDIAAAILTAPSAHEAFKIAEMHKHARRTTWGDVKVKTMLFILRAKVSQHEYVRRKLLDTGDRTLIENSWRDDFWGWGPNKTGKNMLGRLWMQIREELRRG